MNWRIFLKINQTEITSHYSSKQIWKHESRKHLKREAMAGETGRLFASSIRILVRNKNWVGQQGIAKKIISNILENGESSPFIKFPDKELHDQFATMAVQNLPTYRDWGY